MSCRDNGWKDKQESKKLFERFCPMAELQIQTCRSNTKLERSQKEDCRRWWSLRFKEKASLFSLWRVPRAPNMRFVSSWFRTNVVHSTPIISSIGQRLSNFSPRLSHKSNFACESYLIDLTELMWAWLEMAIPRMPICSGLLKLEGANFLTCALHMVCLSCHLMLRLHHLETGPLVRPVKNPWYRARVVQSPADLIFGRTCSDKAEASNGCVRVSCCKKHDSLI